MGKVKDQYKDTMIMGYFRSKRDALNSAKSFRKGSANDIAPEFTLFYRIEKRPGKNKPADYSYKVIRTARRKTESSKKRARNNRRRG